MAALSAMKSRRGSLENLMNVYAQATAAERAQGLLYYISQRNRVHELGKQFGFSLEASAGAFAVLSPNKRERDTYSDLAVCMKHVHADEPGKPRVCAYPKNRDKALLVLQGADPQRVLKGSKVLSFYFNTIDPKDHRWVTVDGHLVSAWVGRTLRMKQAGVTRWEYARIREHVMQAAKSEGIVPCQFHSIIWVVQRRLNKYPDQFVFDF